MAGARTVPELAGSVVYVRIFMLSVRPGLETHSVTTRAIRLIGWLRPGNNLRVRLVTGHTLQTSAMVERLVRQSGVHECVRYPHRRLVTIAAVA